MSMFGHKVESSPYYRGPSWLCRFCSLHTFDKPPPGKKEMFDDDKEDNDNEEWEDNEDEEASAWPKKIFSTEELRTGASS